LLAIAFLLVASRMFMSRCPIRELPAEIPLEPPGFDEAVGPEEHNEEYNGRQESRPCQHKPRRALARASGIRGLQ